MNGDSGGGVLAGILTGALLGVTVAMALAPVETGTERKPGALFARGRSILDAAASGLEPVSSATDLSSSSPRA